MYNIQINEMVSKFYTNIPNDIAVIVINDNTIYNYLNKNRTFFIYKEGRKNWKISNVKYVTDENQIPDKFISHDDTQYLYPTVDAMIIQTRNKILASKLKMLIP